MIQWASVTPTAPPRLRPRPPTVQVRTGDKCQHVSTHNVCHTCDHGGAADSLCTVPCVHIVIISPGPASPGRCCVKCNCGQYFTLATMDNCKKFAVIVSITTICSYINFSHSIWQRPAPKQLWARLTRTLSLVWGRTDKFCQVELNALKEKEENLLWWALRENWRSLKHFKKVIVEKNRNENIQTQLQDEGILWSLPFGQPICLCCLKD